MAKTLDPSLDLLNALHKYVHVHGVEKTLGVLSIEQDQLEFTDPYTKLVIDLVCQSFSIYPKQLIEARYLRGEYKYALGFCVYYLYKQQSLGDIRKNIFPSKDVTLLSKYRLLIEELKPTHRSDINYVNIKTELDKRIIK